jgi:hypothetical protein
LNTVTQTSEAYKVNNRPVQLRLKVPEIDALQDDSGQGSIAAQIEKQSASNRAKVAKERHLQGIFREPRITFYIYLETIERGKENRPVKVVTQINKVTKQYQSEAEDKRQKVYLGVLEKAIETACSKVYELKQKKEPFNRVFISQFKGPDKAKTDPNSFDYC